MDERVIAAGDEKPITLGTWLQFMFGRPAAIEAFARSRNAVWVGLVFVFSAGLAREYDGVYLLREPWHLLLPLAASLGTSLFLYALVYGAARRHQVKLDWWQGYRTLLTYYWMTAPLAWLYAIPVERFLDPRHATEMNFAFLAVVSIWRVVLITRAISVWLDAGYFRVLLIVLFFADSVLFVANLATPTPVWDVMGGIRLPERESIILKVKLLVWMYSSIGWWILLVAAGVTAFWTKSLWHGREHRNPCNMNVGQSMWVFAFTLLAAGVAILPLAQPEQARRWHAEHLLRTGHVSEGIQYMAATTRDNFPPQWDPPPWYSYGENVPPISDVILALYDTSPPSWIRDVYLDKALSYKSELYEAVDEAQKGKKARLESLMSFLERSGPLTSKSDMKIWLTNLTSDTLIDAALLQRIRKYLEAGSKKPETE